MSSNEIPCDKWRSDEERWHGATPSHSHDTTMIRKMAGHILRLQGERFPTYSNAADARRRQKKEVEAGHSKVHSKMTWKRWMPASMEASVSPVTVKIETSRRPMF